MGGPRLIEGKQRNLFTPGDTSNDSLSSLKYIPSCGRPIFNAGRSHFCTTTRETECFIVASSTMMMMCTLVFLFLEIAHRKLWDSIYNSSKFDLCSRFDIRLLRSRAVEIT